MNTRFLLMAEFETGDIPLSIVAKKYLDIDERKMLQMASGRKFPFPIYRAGSQKSQWLVSIDDLANYLDEKKAEAREKFKALQ